MDLSDSCLTLSPLSDPLTLMSRLTPDQTLARTIARIERGDYEGDDTTQRLFDVLIDTITIRDQTIKELTEAVRDLDTEVDDLRRALSDAESNPGSDPLRQ